MTPDDAVGGGEMRGGNWKAAFCFFLQGANGSRVPCVDNLGFYYLMMGWFMGRLVMYLFS